MVAVESMGITLTPKHTTALENDHVERLKSTRSQSESKMAPIKTASLARSMFCIFPKYMREWGTTSFCGEMFRGSVSYRRKGAGMSRRAQTAPEIFSDEHGLNDTFKLKATHGTGH